MFLPDVIHAAGTKIPKDTTPPSLRMQKVPNRKARRQATKRTKATMRKVGK